MKNILLIEPGYKNKYPPLGLMKLSTFHKRKGHRVVFCKGLSQELKNETWDRIYLATLFTFYWSKTMETIKFYSKSVGTSRQIFIGGVLATLHGREIQRQFDVTVVKGLLNKKGMLGYTDDDLVDSILPDYSIIDPKTNRFLDYSYPTGNAYLAYASRGCIRRCRFCAVPVMEPIFTNSISIARQVQAVKRRFGEKQDLLLLDNNILASTQFEEIIEQIKAIGFKRGAKFEVNRQGKKVKLKRTVDFNQGLDARLLDRSKMKLLSEIAIEPIRIAFDDVRFKNIYIEKVRLAAEFGIHNVSNYILYNYYDTPEDLYTRLEINIELNEEFQSQGLDTYVWSFPMRYSPIMGDDCFNRHHVGPHWHKKYLRGIQCILLATHGVVGPKREFFQKSFGRNVREFKDILSLPENYIVFRDKNIKNGKQTRLEDMILELNDCQKDTLRSAVLTDTTNMSIDRMSDKRIRSILRIYKANK